MELMFQPLKKYADFKGRARRKEFWLFFLLTLVISVVCQGLAAMDGAIGILGSAVALVVSLGLLIPSLAVTFRRLHDTNRSAWWILIALIPLIGALVLLYFYVLEGDKETNRFGPDPKGHGAEVFA